MLGAGQQNAIEPSRTFPALDARRQPAPTFGGAIQRGTDDADDRNTARTIGRMVALIAEDSRAPAVISAAADALQEAAPVVTKAQRAYAVFRFIRRRITFENDPPGEEILTRPVELLEKRTGDCEDFTMLAAAMLRAINVASELVTIAADPTDPTRFSHVYLIADTEGAPTGDLPLDTSHGPYPGWSAKALTKTRIWSTAQPMPTPVQTLGASRLGAIDWGSILKIGAETGSKIATARYGTPQLTPGTYVQTGPQGTTMFRQSGDASGLFQFPSTSTGDLGPVLLIGAVAVVVVIIAMGGKR